jgi:hypothetical protein
VTALDQTPGLSALFEELSSRYSCIHAAAPVAVIDEAEPVLSELVRSVLAWEAPGGKAAAALKKIESHVVDYNELRVCLPDEMVAMIGERYPRALERAQRLRAMLGELYARSHTVSLEHLTAMNKREARVYLDSLDGMMPFVAARVTLLCMGCHAAPMDERMLAALTAAGAVEPGTTTDAAAGLLERRVRAGELANIYVRLQAWADDGGGVSCGGKACPGEPGGRAGAGKQSKGAEPGGRQPGRKPERPSRA